MTPSPDEFDQTILSLEAGELLSNRYRLLRELGRGGMGIVWLAEDTTLDDRKVAIKLLPTALTTNARAVARLKKEAATCLELTHPHVVRLLNFEQDESRGKLAFLVMQYVDGHTLDDLLADHPDGLPLERVLKWAPQIAQALDHAHEKGVLHRDIKPSNIMIDADDHAYLMDFGIAREAKDTMTRVTGRDSSGTLPYMSPQQLRGHNEKSNDIYSLAATLYETISGEPPFTTGDLQHQILREMPASINDQPKHVNDALLAGLSKESQARPPSAALLAQAIAGQSKLLTTSTTSAPSRRRAPLFAAFLLVLVAAVTIVIWPPWVGVRSEVRTDESGAMDSELGDPRSIETTDESRGEDTESADEEYASIADLIELEGALADAQFRTANLTFAVHVSIASELVRAQSFAGTARENKSLGDFNATADAYSIAIEDLDRAFELDAKASNADAKRESWDSVAALIPESLYGGVRDKVAMILEQAASAERAFTSGEFDTAGLVWDGAAQMLAAAFDAHNASMGQPLVKLLSNDIAPGDRFGNSVAINGPPGKEVAIVGSYLDDDNGTDSGSAYLFDTTTGNQIAKLLANDGAADDHFGWSVAISGTTAIVGTLTHDVNTDRSGSAYLFDTTTGQQIAKLLPDDGAAKDRFGASVAISGAIAIVGAFGDDDNGNHSGSAYLFDISEPANPMQIAKLLPDDGAADDRFGWSVAISSATAIVGARDDHNGENSGAAYLFAAHSPIRAGVGDVSIAEEAQSAVEPSEPDSTADAEAEAIRLHGQIQPERDELRTQLLADFDAGYKTATELLAKYDFDGAERAILIVQIRIRQDGNLIGQNRKLLSETEFAELDKKAEDLLEAIAKARQR